MSAQTRPRPLAGGRRFEQETSLMARLYGPARSAVRASRRLPADWRNRLPGPDQYFSVHLERLSQPNSEGWASGLCPFHKDRTPSFSVNLQHGHWRCHACGLRGDLVTFHQRLTGLPFVDAVADLLGMGVRR